jgi:hypothetical protein
MSPDSRTCGETRSRRDTVLEILAARFRKATECTAQRALITCLGCFLAFCSRLHLRPDKISGILKERKISLADISRHRSCLRYRREMNEIIYFETSFVVFESSLIKVSFADT